MGEGETEERREKERYEVSFKIGRKGLRNEERGEEGEVQGKKKKEKGKFDLEERKLASEKVSGRNWKCFESDVEKKET